MSTENKLLRHTFHYFSGEVLVLASSLISLPVLTRVLTVDEYGQMTLITSFLFIAVGVSKLGLNHSAIRFYGEFRAAGGKNLSEFYSTLFLTSIVAGVLVALLTGIVPRFIPQINWSKDLFNLLAFVAVSIPLRSAMGIFIAFVRAEEKSKFYNVFSVVSRYFSLGASLGFLLYFMKNLYGYYGGLIFAEIMAFVFVLYLLIKDRKIGVGKISNTFLKDSLKYGLPLFGFEIASSVLSYGDRFLVEHYLNSEMLAYYSVGYNCSSYVADLIVLPLRTAIIPIYINLWFSDGEEATKRFLEKSYGYFMLLFFAIIFGVVGIREELITLVASNKYLKAQEVVPYIIAGKLINGTHTFFAAGLFIFKKTYVLTVSLALACVLNFALNIFLIPEFGLKGAAAANLITYVILNITIMMYSFRLIKFKIEYYSILKYGVSAAIMFLIIQRIEIYNRVAQMFFKVAVGILVYSTLVVILDSGVREGMGKYLRRYVWKKLK